MSRFCYGAHLRHTHTIVTKGFKELAAYDTVAIVITMITANKTPTTRAVWKANLHIFLCLLLGTWNLPSTELTQPSIGTDYVDYGMH